MAYFYHFLALASLLFPSLSSCLRYESAYVDYNLNQDQSAKHPADYWGQRENHTFHPSPENWRFPFYTLFLDRFVNGAPENGGSSCKYR